MRAIQLVLADNAIELGFRVSPEDKALPLFVEEVLESRDDLRRVHDLGCLREPINELGNAPLPLKSLLGVAPARGDPGQRLARVEQG